METRQQWAHHLEEFVRKADHPPRQLRAIRTSMAYSVFPKRTTRFNSRRLGHILLQNCDSASRLRSRRYSVAESRRGHVDSQAMGLVFHPLHFVIFCFWNRGLLEISAASDVGRSITPGGDVADVALRHSKTGNGRNANQCSTRAQAVSRFRVVVVRSRNCRFRRIQVRETTNAAWTDRGNHRLHSLARSTVMESALNGSCKTAARPGIRQTRSSAMERRRA